MALLFLIPAACSMLPEFGGEPAPEDIFGYTPPELQPKIVLQSLPTNGVEVAAWSLDDRFIITAVGSTRSIAIWEVETGNIVDRLRIPAEEGRTGALLRLNSIEVVGDDLSSQTAIIEGVSARYLGKGSYGEPVALRYELDLQSREIRNTQATEDPELSWDLAEFEYMDDALETIFENSDDWDFETALEYLLPLPASHDGYWTLERRPTPYETPDDSMPQGGLILTNTIDGSQRELLHTPMQKFDSASLSSNGRWMAMINDKMESFGEFDLDHSLIAIYDSQSATIENEVWIVGDYGLIQWISEDRFVVTQPSSIKDIERAGPEEIGPPPPAIVINARTGEIEEEIESRCYLRVLPDGGFIGAGLPNCRALRQEYPFGLEKYDPNTRTWRAFGPQGIESEGFVDLMAVSPDGSLVAVTTFEGDLEAYANDGDDDHDGNDEDDGESDGEESGDDSETQIELDDDVDNETDEAEDYAIVLSAYIIDVETGKVLFNRVMDGLKFNTMMAFSPDGEELVVSGNSEVFRWKFASNEWVATSQNTLDTTVLARNGDLLAIAGEADDAIGLYDFETGQRVRALEFASVTAGGFVPDQPLFWAFSSEEGLRFWDTRTWSIVITTYFFDNQGFLSVTPEGRYDSNIHPYDAKFRWLVPDQPWASLNPDAFSRDYYAPGLTERWLKCSIARSCEASFEKLRPIAELNRDLPKVEIVSVETGSTLEEAIVTVEFTPPDADGGLAVFDPRLFRNHQLVFRQDSAVTEQGDALADWREANLLAGEHVEAVDGRYRIRARVRLPTGDAPHEATPIFSAYAFNADRIKSETAEFRRYQRPAMLARQPKAFVITFGIDHYREDRLNLSFAGNDARLMGDRLADIPGYDTRRVTIFTAGSDQAEAHSGLPAFISPQVVRDVLGILADSEAIDAKASLSRLGIDTAGLEYAGPDDLVIVSFAGHGWTDPLGEFYLVTSDASWAASDGSPQMDGLISSTQLAGWLSRIDAGAMTLIIDACHSAASVENGSFKPGPLGDPGLGQLAFDKGVRILTATQADDVALEDANLKQGLLTYVLAGEGLSPAGAKADLDGDRRITMSEWLGYAVQRLPELQIDARVDGVRSASVVFHDIPAEQAEKKVQEPSLFDFTVRSSPIYLQGAAR